MDPLDASSTGSSEGGRDSTGPMLVGDPPEPRSFTATEDFERLPDDDAFTEFSVEGNRLQVLPLRPENFPPDVDYCTVGSDTALNELQQFARARLTTSLSTWVYDVTITLVAEEDGESEFALAINGESVATVAAPQTDITPGVGDMNDFQHTWRDVLIREGDVVEVWGRAHSNLGLEEGAGCRDWSPTFAWARGRWRALDLAAAQDL